MIDRRVVRTNIEGRELQVTIEDHASQGGGVVLSSADLNHAIHMISDTSWVLRDCAALDGTLAVIEQHGREFKVRPLTDDEKTAWAHGSSTIVLPSPPTPAFKVGSVDGYERQFGAVDEHDTNDRGIGSDEEQGLRTSRMGEGGRADDVVEHGRHYLPAGHMGTGLAPTLGDEDRLREREFVRDDYRAQAPIPPVVDPMDGTHHEPLVPAEDEAEFNDDRGEQHAPDQEMRAGAMGGHLPIVDGLDEPKADERELHEVKHHEFDAEDKDRRIPFETSSYKTNIDEPQQYGDVKPDTSRPLATLADKEHELGSD